MVQHDSTTVCFMFYMFIMGFDHHFLSFWWLKPPTKYLVARVTILCPGVAISGAQLDSSRAGHKGRTLASPLKTPSLHHSFIIS